MADDIKKAIPAFPTIVPKESRYADYGMTLRDYFAAKAMQSLLMHQEGFYYWEEVSSHAYRIADKMMEERDK